MSEAIKRQRTAFFVSDGTGITAETLGHSLLTQFEDEIEFNQRSLRFVDDLERAEWACEEINQIADLDEFPPLVFSTSVNPQIRDTLRSANCVFFDIFETFITRLGQELNATPTLKSGQAYGMADLESYFNRMDAVNFTLNHDDGSAISHLDQADIILIGISRTGKTPTCIYLSLHYSIRGANFPLTEDDLEDLRLPDILQTHRHKLFGLTIDPERLQQIRHERLPNSRYASPAQCAFEVRQSEAMYRKLNIPYLSTSMKSVEEIAATIIEEAGLERNPPPPIGPSYR